jgi:hypothetical protein
VTRRRRPGFTPGSRRCGRQLSPRPSDASPTARRLPRTAPPVTGRLRSPPYPAAAPRQHHDQAVTLTPGAPGAGKMSERQGRNAAHCPGWPLQPQRCSASRCAGRACGAPLTLETSASPAGLTARARPKGRPGMHTANLLIRERRRERATYLNPYPGDHPAQVPGSLKKNTKPY